MAHCLLWLRTTRALDTYGPPDWARFDTAFDRLNPDMLRGEMTGTDSLVFAAEWEDGPDALANMVRPELDAHPFEDWCIVEVGKGAAWDRNREEDDPDYEPDLGRFLDVWPVRSPVNCYGATAILIDLDRDIDQRRDSFIDRLQRRLGIHAGRFWQSRSMVLLPFHDGRDTELIASSLGPQLADECVADWLIFSLGSRVASKANLSGLSGWLDRNYRVARNIPVQPRRPQGQRPQHRRDADIRLGGPRLGVRR